VSRRATDAAGTRAVVRLKAGRERSLQKRHPWVFSGAIDRVEGGPQPGDIVRIESADGRFVALAAYSPRSQIRARVWAWDETAVIDDRFIAERVAAAVAARRPRAAPAGAERLVNAEADGLPGIVVDRYADVAVIQLLSAGAERVREALVATLAVFPGIAVVHERSDADARALEGLAERTGTLHGTLPPSIVVEEPGPAHVARFEIDVVRGHKTGFYLDQRDNRLRVAAESRGARVLNCFAYTGGFAIHAALAGAQSVVSIDSSAEAIAAGRRNAALNGLDAERTTWIEGDVFKELRRLRDEGATFDVIVLDPPKFAAAAAHVDRAARAYKDINLIALKLLRTEGVLATFSCSGAIDTTLFRKIVAGACQDAGGDAQVLEIVGASSDHPVMLSFPEGEYLKGFLLRRR
jgi:23S rRNA (cytosine1962-C5)-methyltransferase